MDKTPAGGAPEAGRASVSAHPAPTLAILLATYNGERYISEQIDSLLSQTWGAFTLYIHDDGSTDATPRIISLYSRRDPRVRLMSYAPQGGSKNNFLSMLRRVEADYYMFSDQDDVWRGDKIECEMEAMRREEGKAGQGAIIVFSDLEIVDSDLKPLHPSLWKLSNIHPDLLTTFEASAASNVATGSTMLFNRQAKQCVVWHAAHITMHDAWVVACVLKAGGRLVPLNTPLVRYRQHGDNAVGAVDASRLTLIYRLRHMGEIIRLNRERYLMLRSLGYGSLWKYIKYKRIYLKAIHDLGMRSDI